MGKRDDALRERDAQIDAMIDRFDMEKRCGLSREEIHRKVRKSMVLNNLAFVFADAANTFLMDAEDSLKGIGVAFTHKDRYNFSQMMKALGSARAWAAQSALPIYNIPDVDDACADSDWWHNLFLLIDDRLGDDARKTNMFLEYLLAMPSAVGLFDITYDDFKNFNHER
jgi:hypothetical protein